MLVKLYLVKYLVMLVMTQTYICFVMILTYICETLVRLCDIYVTVGDVWLVIQTW